MSEQETRKRAMDLKREGKAPSTQAGEFVREEIPSYSRGQAWCSFCQTSHCHWVVESQKTGCSSQAAT